ncbi:MAG: hypothetical protein GY856_33445, partial [bacterium]|nr:hypothetical protein [bacterium]
MTRFATPSLLLPILIALTTLPLRAEKRTLAVRTPADAPQVAAALQEGSFMRWVLPRRDDIEVEIGPSARGDVEILVEILPVSEAVAARLAGLPVALDDGVISFGGEVYRDPRHALAVRLPASAKPTWVVSGYRTPEVTALADRVLMAASGARFHRSRKDFDYWLFENPWLGRRGRWQQAPSGPALDPEEEDGFAVRDAAYARLRTIRLRHVRLRMPADDLGDDAGRRLAHALDAAAAAMAARVPMAL